MSFFRISTPKAKFWSIFFSHWTKHYRNSYYFYSVCVFWFWGLF